MKLANRLDIPVLEEGLNVLKVAPGALLGQTWSRPVSVNLLLTTRCNSKCATCDSWKLTDHDNELTLQDYQRLATETAELGTPIVTIGGGEPTLRQDLWDIVKAFKAQGRSVQLTTNALTLREGQRQKLYASGADRVTLSVDSHLPDTYEKIRGVAGAEAVLSHLRALLAEKPAHLEVDTNTVLCRDNADTFLDTLDHLIAMGVPKVNFSAVTTAANNYLMTDTKSHLADIPLETVARIQEGLLQRKRTTSAIAASTAFIEGLTRYYERPDQVVYDCYAGYLTLDIFQDGKIHGCGNLPSYGNVREGSLKTIWHSAAAQALRDQMKAGKCPNCYLSCKMELAIAATPTRLPRFAFEKMFGR